MTGGGPAEAFAARLDAVEARLARHAEVDPPPGLTDPDPPTGERWDAGQVWAHLAEFVPYWMAQAGDLIRAHDRDPLPFGRTKADPERIAAIERDRHRAVPALWERTRLAILDLRDWLLRIAEPQWGAQGLHRTLGVMSTERIVEEFLVGHLEQHADQLDGLGPGAGPTGGAS